MSDLSLALECLAVGVHFASGKKSGWETTSACYYTENNTVYITSQNPNHTFLSIPMLPESDYEKALEAITKWIPAQPVSAQMRLMKSVVPSSKHAPEDQFSLKKQRSSISRVWMVECFNAGCRALTEERFDQVAKPLFEKDPVLKIVNDSDIFAQGVTAYSGFHGESRLLRYLLIKLLRKDLKGALLTKTDLAPKKLEEEFLNRVGGKLFMGSNRPACADCANFMDTLKVDYESRTKNTAKSEVDWIHPFFLDQKTDTVTAVALAQAQRSLS